MNKYGETALKAVEIYKKGYTPKEAWSKAASDIFGNSTSKSKSCPKSTFLGLCEEGLINNISTGSYTKSKKNKEYALSAVDYLRTHSKESILPGNLWKKISDGNISHNSQMDVVLSLWEKNLIK